MPHETPTLYLVSGKAASGKSTLCEELSTASQTVKISEDEWLHTLFADDMSTIADYVRCSAKLKQIMQPHVVALLNEGVSVVLDFPANTVENRKWMLQIISQTGANHELHYLDVPGEVCKARLRRRNESSEHPFAVTDEQFDKLSSYFEEPTAKEGFNIVRHRIDERP